MTARREFDGAQGSGKGHLLSNQSYQAGAQVLYIHPSKQGIAYRSNKDMGRPYGLFPLGLPGLINRLRENGIRVRGVNHSLEVELDDTFSLATWLSRQQKAKVVLIDMHWYEHCYGAIDAAHWVKQVLPDALVVMGGLSATAFSRQILENFREVDFIIRGDAEKPLLELVQLLLKTDRQAADRVDLGRIPNLSYRKEGQVVENGMAYTGATEDLDDLNFVDIDFMDHYQEYCAHEYVVTDITAARRALESKPFTGRWLCTARGCKYHCSYCGGSKESNKILANRFGIVPRSAEKVVADLGRLKELGVIQASLSYDIAEMGKDYWQDFFARLRASGTEISIYNEFFQLPEAAFIDDFVRSVDMSQSCVALSPLSGNERVRRLNGKHFSNEALFDMLNLLNQHHFYVFVYFSLNLPGENEETLKETIDLARDIYDFYPANLLKILDTVHTLDPISPMALSPEKYGIRTSMSSFMDFYQYCYNTRNGSDDARTEQYRGYTFADPQARSMEKMADRWDRERIGRESSWWPTPPSW
ncbi:MAG TPA: radical SAM protein [Anaerolineaceae bacterium]|jgi:Radical SAM superfamily